jgi:inner membrane protein
MLGISHILISGTATSLLLGTASPTIIAVGAIAGLLPDIDVSTSPVRCVCPGNRNLRLRTGSNAEYFVLVLLIAIALAIFNINNSGGLLTQFNRLIAAPSGVQKIYNEFGSTRLIKANIKGVRTTDRSRVVGQFLIIQSFGTGFLVQADDGRIYKASTEPDSQIFLEEITADVGKPAITNIESKL